MIKNKYGPILYAVIIIFGLFTSFYLNYDKNLPNYYNYLPLLPIIHSLMTMFMISVFIKNTINIGSWLIIIFYTIRNVLNPLFMRLGDYSGIIQVSSETSVNLALLLMTYETFLVYLTILYYINIKEKTRNKEKSSSKIGSRINLIHGSLFVLTLICIFGYIYQPAIRANFNSIFDVDSVIGDNYSEYIGMFALGSLNRILLSLVLFLVPILQVIVPVVLFSKIRSKYGESKISVVLSMMIIFSIFFMIPESNMRAFVIGITLCLVLVRMYVKYRKSILITVSLVVGFGIIAIASAKSNTGLITAESNFIVLSRLFQSYFQGVSNVAGVFNINNPNKLSSLFYDFFHMIPFRNSLFGWANLNGQRLVQIYTASNFVNSQIIPGIGQAYHYLGFLFAPIIPMLLARKAVLTSAIISYENNMIKYAYHITLIIYLSFGIALNNFTIFGTHLLNFMLPMLLLSKITGKHYLFNNLRLNKDEVESLSETEYGVTYERNEV